MSKLTFAGTPWVLPFRRSALCLALWACFASVANAQEPAAGATAAPAAAEGDADVDAALDELLGSDFDSPAQDAAPAASATSDEPAAPQQAAQPAPANAVAQDPAKDSFEELDTIPVLAREPQVPQPLAEQPHRAQIEEIVVTATKREQSVREIPVTINVLSGDKLAAQGARELQDFVDQVPGLQMQDVAVTSARKVVIRGIAPDNTTNQTVGTVLGDVPLGDPIGNATVIDPDTFDLKTVEVLKGPQGTLFGASSLAGIIRYVPNGPTLGAWEGKAFVEWTSIKDGGSTPTFGGAINMPVGETLAFRLAGISDHRPGVIDIDNPRRQEKDADDARKWAGRAMLRWEPSDELSINAWYMAQERRADEAFFVTNFEADYTRYDSPESSPTRRYFDLTTLDVRYRFDWATLVSLTALQNKENEFDSDTSYALVAPAGELGIAVGRSKRIADATGFMQELRLVSEGDGPWTWQAGAFFSSFEADIYSDIYVPRTRLPGLNLLPEVLRNAIFTERGLSLGNSHLSPLDAEETALFGEVTRALGPVDVTVGGRLYQTQVSGTSRTAGLLPFISNRRSETIEDLDVEGKGFSPKFSLAWQATDDVRVYGTVSRGFQYGGVNAIAIPSPTSTAPKTYESSELWSYEAGIRTNWLDGSLHADLTAFYQQWSNAQVSQIAPPAEAYVDNVGEVEVAGLEMAIQYLTPIEGLSLDLNGSYLESKTAVVFEDSEGNDIPEGTTMPNAPRIQAAAGINYSRVFGASWATNTGLQYSYADKAWGNIEHTGKLDARNLLNFNFSVTRSDLAFAPSLSLIVNNLTDQRKIVSATRTEDPNFIENTPVGYTRPRTLILRIGAEFK